MMVWCEVRREALKKDLAANFSRVGLAGVRSSVCCENTLLLQHETRPGNEQTTDCLLCLLLK